MSSAATEARTGSSTAPTTRSGGWPTAAACHGDLHEFLITSRGTALITIYQQVTADLSSIGGPVDGQLVVGVVQELDIPTGKVLFEWRSDDHIPLTESNMPQVTMAGNVDYFHLNSVGVDLDATCSSRRATPARSTSWIERRERIVELGS